EKLQPYYQKIADLQFADALRQIKNRHADTALPALEKIGRLICEPDEGLLTLCFVEFSTGNRSKAMAALTEWLQAGKRTPEEVAQIRLTTYYDREMVKEALDDDGIHQKLMEAFGSKAGARLNKLVEDSFVGEEPI